MNDYFGEYRQQMMNVFEAYGYTAPGPFYTEDQLDGTDQDLVETEKRFLDFEAGLLFVENDCA